METVKTLFTLSRLSLQQQQIVNLNPRVAQLEFFSANVIGTDSALYLTHTNTNTESVSA